MEMLRIDPTERTPLIILDPIGHKFEISGISVPENVLDYYDGVFNWLELYSSNPLDSTVFNFNFNYFNTSSLKSFLIILSKLKKIKESGKEMIIKWHYMEDDDAMLEAGELLQDLCDIDFVFEIYK